MKKIKFRFLLLPLSFALSVSSCNQVTFASSITDNSSVSSSVTAGVTSDSGNKTDSSKTDSSAPSFPDSSISAGASTTGSNSKDDEDNDKHNNLDKLIDKITLSIDNISEKYLSDITASDIKVSAFDTKLYKITLELDKDSKDNSLEVDYYLTEIKTDKKSKKKEKEFTGFKLPEYEIEKNLNITGFDDDKSIDEGSSFSFSVSLSSKPRNNIDISLSLSNENGTLSSSLLTFTPLDFSTYKNVSLSIIKDTSFDDKDVYVSFSHSRKEIKKRHLIIKNIDIIEKPTIIFPSSLTIKKNKSTEISISSSSDKVTFDNKSLVFDKNNYKTEQAFFFTIEEAETASSITFTLSSKDLVSKQIQVDIEETEKENFEYLIPFESGFITDPVYYYTAYYDVDFKIDKLSVSFNGSDVFTDITEIMDSTFTNNACMIYLRTFNFPSNPTVRLKADYSKKTEKLVGKPTFELEGYRIKATLGSYTEYFLPSAVSPYALINISTEVKLENFLHFTRESASGVVEEFYLVLRPKSGSRLSVDGLSPTSFAKVIEVSSHRNKRFYERNFLNYYSYNNDLKVITFNDNTSKDLDNYSDWKKTLNESVNVFNKSMVSFGLDISLKEDSESRNSVHYGELDFESPMGGTTAGLCKFSATNNRFEIFLNNGPYVLPTKEKMKSAITHEIGHLLGLADFPYASSDSLYSYGRDSEVIYFQPNYIVTFRSWIDKENTSTFF